MAETTQISERLTVIIIDYHSVSDTFSYLHHIVSSTQNSHLLDFVIVDNTEGDYFHRYISENDIPVSEGGFSYRGKVLPCYTLLISSISNPITWLVAGTNLGYACGNNLGVEYQNKVFHNSYLVISNNDLEFNSNTFDWKAFPEFFASHLNCAVVGPEIVGRTHRPQSPCRKNSLLNLMVLPFYNRLLGGMLNRQLTSVIENCPEGEVYWVSGCFCILNAALFEQVGRYDEATFLYAEEMILAERLQTAGYSIYYWPKYSLTHFQSKVVNSTLTRRDIDHITLQSLGHYFTHYRHTPTICVALAKASYELYSLLNIIRNALRSVYHHLKKA